MTSSPDPPQPDATRTATDRARPAQTIGTYRLLQSLGEGGMGEVWLAEQTHPVHRQVAFKVIKAGMDTRQVVARFEAERQALALMDHPAIATVFDGGSTPDGRPYFAMEYVRGEPITAYCDRQRLSMAERLELFMQVCDGVQHAHQKGIIHRDLKPSNVLVMVQDDRAVPKIIDFGVAKAVAQPLTERSLFTELGVLIGTPEYMSPEQAEMSGLDIDTRTDVYALGVMLYELLTGALPFDRKALRESGLDAVRRTIREKTPPKPSTRVTQLGPASAEAAANRHTESARLASQLRGDLDWITLKALEKDRTRRYATANALAADVRRHLNHEPVMAGPPSTLYRARKFVRRHRFGVAAMLTFVLLVVSFGVTMAVQAQRIARERDRANEEAQAKQQVAQFLKDLFTLSDPGRARGATITAREILDEGAKNIDWTLKGQPAVRAELLATLADVYASLGLYAEAERLTQQAADLRVHVLGAVHPDTLDTVRKLGWLVGVRGGRADDGERLLKRNLENARRALGDEHEVTLRTKAALATTYDKAKRYVEAEALFLEVLSTQRKVLGEDHPDTLASMNNLANAYYGQGRHEESGKLDEEILARRRRLLGDDHPLTIGSMNNLAFRYVAMKRYSEARRLLQLAIALGEKVWGPTHPQEAVLIHSLGELCLAEGKPQEAEVHLRRTLEVYDLRSYAEARPLALCELAQVSVALNKRDQALAFLARALDEGYVHEGGPLGFVNDPAFASLRGDPRFDALASKARRHDKTR